MADGTAGTTPAPASRNAAVRMISRCGGELHPRRDDARRGGIGERAPAEILGGREARRPCSVGDGRDQRSWRLPSWAVVAVVVAVHHAPDQRCGHGLQFVVGAQRAQVVSGAHLIDQTQCRPVDGRRVGGSGPQAGVRAERGRLRASRCSPARSRASAARRRTAPAARGVPARSRSAHRCSSPMSALPETECRHPCRGRRSKRRAGVKARPAWLCRRHDAPRGGLMRACVIPWGVVQWQDIRFWS